MRKFFALALAVAMVMSLAAVSFAASTVPPAIGDEAFKHAYKYSGDSDVMDEIPTHQYGKAVYFQLTNAADEAIKDFAQVEKLKAKIEYEMGEEYVESVSIVKKYIEPEFSLSLDEDTMKAVASVNGSADVVDIAGVSAADMEGATFTFKFDDDGDEEADDDGDQDTTFADAAEFNTIDEKTIVPATVFAADYYYFVEFKTKAERITAENDVIGTIEFNRKKNDDKGVVQVKDEEQDFAFTLGIEKNYNDNTALEITGDTADMKWDDLYLLKFDYDDVCEIEFGKHSDCNEGKFSVDVSGQNKLIVDFNTKANEAIADANPGVVMHFVNFNGAKFNRTGEFEYELEDMAAAYEVVDGKLVEIAGLEIDADVATFNTAKLGNYVFATAELVNPVA